MLEVVSGIGMDVRCRVRSASDVGLECTNWAYQLLRLETEAVLLRELWNCMKLLGAEVPVANPMSEHLELVSR